MPSIDGVPVSKEDIDNWHRNNGRHHLVTPQLNVHSELHDMSRQLAAYMEARITAAGVGVNEEQLKLLRKELLRTADAVLTPNAPTTRSSELISPPPR